MTEVFRHRIYRTLSHLAAGKVFLPLQEITRFPILGVTILCSLRSIFTSSYQQQEERPLASEGSLGRSCSSAVHLWYIFIWYTTYSFPSTAPSPTKLLCLLSGCQPGSPSTLPDVTTNFVQLEKFYTNSTSVSRTFCSRFPTICHITWSVNPTHHFPQSHCC